MDREFKISQRSLSILFALFFAGLCFRKISEADVFLLIRAGENLFKFGTLQIVGRWSHTVNDASWYNYEWLSSVWFYLLSRLLPNELGLTCLRVFFVFILFVTNHQLMVDENKKHADNILNLMIFSPFLFAILGVYFELRAGIITYIAFSYLLWNWTRDRTLSRAASMGCLTLVLTSNFHAGISLVLIPIQLGFIWSEGKGFGTSKLSIEKIKWSILSILAIFFTPLGLNVLKPIVQTAGVDWEVTGNPDLAPFRMKLLDPEFAGFSFWVWIGSVIGCVFTLFFEWNAHRKRDIGGKSEAVIGRNFKLNLAFILYLFYTVAAFIKIRMVPYQAILSVPILICGLKRLMCQTFWHSRRSSLAGLCFLTMSVVIYHTNGMYFSVPFGFGPVASRYPIKSIDFFKKFSPKGELCNSANIGGYLIDQLRDYPVSSDTRNDVNVKVDLELNHGFKKPEFFRELLTKWNCNAGVFSLFPLLIEQSDRSRRLIGGSRLVFPKDGWAMVFFDEATEVFLRRIPEHQTLIQRHEFKCLDRAWPIGYIADSPSFSKVERAQCVSEVERCLVETPQNPYCLATKGTILRSKGLLKQGRELLSQAKVLGVNDSFIDYELDRTN